MFISCYFRIATFCLLRLNFFFLAQLRIKAIFTSAFNESLHMGFDKRCINNIYYSWSCFKIFGQQKINNIFQVITIFFSYRFMLIFYNLKNNYLENSQHEMHASTCTAHKECIQVPKYLTNTCMANFGTLHETCREFPILSLHDQ